MKLDRTMYFLMIASSALWAGCVPGSVDPGPAPDAAMPPGDPDSGMPEPPEVPVDAAPGPPRCPSDPGDLDYCSVAYPCLPGQGDCDTDAHCGPDGLCLHDVGAAFGYTDPGLDVCSAACPDQGNGARNYCSAACPCAIGEGDCDSDAECLPGLTCEHDAGTAHGLDADVDVCVDLMGCADDALEFNDLPAIATKLEYTKFGPVLGSSSFEAKINPVSAQLCAGDEDWYRLPPGQVEQFYRFQLSVHIEGARRCDYRPYCIPPALEPSPENTLTVEVYDPTGTQLLASETSEVGALRISRTLDNPAFFTGRLLIRVSGPAVAQYRYTLDLWMPTDLGGHGDCDCS